jgi:hypothetical protein
MEHKFTAEIKSITLIDVRKVKASPISLEILWLATKDSPGRLIFNSIVDQIEAIQVLYLSTVNKVVQL